MGPAGVRADAAGVPEARGRLAGAAVPVPGARQLLVVLRARAGGAADDGAGGVGQPAGEARGLAAGEVRLAADGVGPEREDLPQPAPAAPQPDAGEAAAVAVRVRVAGELGARH